MSINRVTVTSVVPSSTDSCCKFDESGDRVITSPDPICMDEAGVAQAGILIAKLKSVSLVIVYCKVEEKG